MMRELALALLDDEHGINEKAFTILATMLRATGNSDILARVEATDGRYYIKK